MRILTPIQIGIYFADTDPVQCPSAVFSIVSNQTSDAVKTALLKRLLTIPKGEHPGVVAALLLMHLTTCSQKTALVIERELRHDSAGFLAVTPTRLKQFGQCHLPPEHWLLTGESPR